MKDPETVVLRKVPRQIAHPRPVHEYREPNRSRGLGTNFLGKLAVSLHHP